MFHTCNNQKHKITPEQAVQVSRNLHKDDAMEVMAVEMSVEASVKSKLSVFPNEADILLIFISYDCCKN